MRDLKGPWQSVQKIRLQKFAALQVFPFMVVAFWSQKGWDRFAVESQCPRLLVFPTLHMESYSSHYSNLFLFNIYSNLLLLNCQHGSQMVEQPEPCFGGWSQPKTHKKTQFLVCWKRWLLVLSRNQHRNCLTSFVLFPLSLPFPRSAVNLIIPKIRVMEIKTEHTFSHAHGLTSSKKKCSEVFIKVTCTFYKISVSINC